MIRVISGWSDSILLTLVGMVTERRRLSLTVMLWERAESPDAQTISSEKKRMPAAGTAARRKTADGPGEGIGEVRR
jgi:hypothetical protein